MSPTLKSDPAIAPAPNPCLQRADSGETERPPSGQRTTVIDMGSATDADDIEQMSTEDEQDPAAAQQEKDEDEAADPGEQIEALNWEDLQSRYHEAISQAQEDETKLMREWEQLMEYFKIWSSAGHLQETDRTFSRLKTRIAYVENAESKLENTRNHYVSVVDAFERALALLRNTGFRV